MRMHLKSWILEHRPDSLWKGLAFRVVGLSSVILFSSCTTLGQKPAENSYKLHTSGTSPNPATGGQATGSVQGSGTGQQGSVGHYREQLTPVKPNSTGIGNEIVPTTPNPTNVR